MRPKIVILALLAGLAGIIGIMLVKPLTAPIATKEIPSTAAPASQHEQEAESPVTPASVPDAVTKLAPVQPLVPEVDDLETNAEHEAEVQVKIDRLQELQAKDDPASLNAILAELINPDHEVRAAAVEATIQFGDRSAIPTLKNLAATTTDNDEKRALLDAVEFLSLTTLTEVHTTEVHAASQPSQ